jgi:glycosyltransferase involved in cell wall biosynthesis
MGKLGKQGRRLQSDESRRGSESKAKIDVFGIIARRCEATNGPQNIGPDHQDSRLENDRLRLSEEFQRVGETCHLEGHGERFRRGQPLPERNVPARDDGGPLSLGDGARESRQCPREPLVVAVEKCDIFTRGGANSRVASDALTLVLLAQKAEAIAILDQHLRCAVGRSVVHYNKLKIPELLLQYRIDRGPAKLHPIERRNDYGKERHAQRTVPSASDLLQPASSASFRVPSFITMTAVGIIIPCYNSARFLPQTIQSIREQTFTDWKCVIVDDCSVDNSRDIARSACDGDSRFSLLALTENSGTSSARNAGLAALGDTVRCVIFLDSDDVWNASSLQNLIDAIEGHPAWIAVYGNCRLINQDGAYVGSDEVENAGRERFDFHDGRLVQLTGAAETSFCQFLLRNPVVSPGCLLIRADVIANVTGKSSMLFDPRTKYGEDLGAWLRIRRAGCIGHVDQTVLDYRVHSSNKSNRRLGVAVGVRKVRLKALLDPTLEHDEIRQACAASRAYRRYRIREEIRSAACYLYDRRIRAGVRSSICSVVNAIDMLLILAIQVGHSARIVACRRNQFALRGSRAG